MEGKEVVIEGLKGVLTKISEGKKREGKKREGKKN
jgi:hypothetical protein